MKPKIALQCRQCKTDFVPKAKELYCSDACRTQRKKDFIRKQNEKLRQKVKTGICIVCNTEFEYTNASNTRTICSDVCKKARYRIMQEKRLCKELQKKTVRQKTISQLYEAKQDVAIALKNTGLMSAV